MFIAREFVQVADNTPVHVPLIVEDSATTRSPAQEGNNLQCVLLLSRTEWCPMLETSDEVQINLEPRVLVSTNDNAREISVEEEDLGARWCFLEQIMLNGKIEKWIRRLGGINLNFVGRARD